MVRPPDITASRFGAWPRRLVLLFLVALVGAAAYRFVGVYRQHAARAALDQSGWTVIYSDPAASTPSSFVQQLLSRLDSSGRIGSYLGGAEPEPVSVSIIELEEGHLEQDLGLLTRLPKLETLAVHRAGLSRDDLALIASLSTLKELSLTADDLDDEGVALLADLTLLERITLAGPRVTDEGIAALATLPRLQHLDVQSTRVSGIGLNDFAAAGSLRSLSLGPYTVDAGLLVAGKLLTLQELTVAGRAITDEGLAALRGLQELQFLAIVEHPQVTDDGLTVIAELKSLQVCAIHSHRITFDGASQLQGLPALVDLELRGGKLDDAGLARYLPPASLQVLRLDHTSVSEKAFDAFEAAHPTLKLWR